MKIVSTGSTLSSPEFQQKKQKARRRRRVIYAILFFILFIIVVFVSRLENLRIGTVSVNGSNVISQDLVIAVAKDQISGHYLWLVPKDNALFYPKGALRKMLFRKFPRFSSVALSLEGTEALEISVIEREPFALFCTGDSNTCYFLDETGFIFDFAPNFSEGVYFVYQREELSGDPLSQEFLPESEFRQLSRFVSSLPDMGLEPLSLTMSQSEIELSVRGGIKVLWLRESDIERTLSNLESFLMSPTIKGDESFLERVAVLDLRTEDKVFYSFK
jgi:cell division septal protein FtsQ